MSLYSETVATAGSGLVFVNVYGSGVTEAFRSAIITAETYLQAQFTNPLTLNMSFDFRPLGGGSGGQNTFHPVSISYADLRGAMTSHATTADDFLAANSLPTGDPSGGRGFAVPIGMARILGLAGPGNGIDDAIVLNSLQPFTFGPDVVGVLLHEITEGAMGRIGSLGVWDGNGRFAPMDLFRFDASGQRNYTGGHDGVPTYFGVDGAHLTSFQYHSSIDRNGGYDRFDLSDWDFTVGDAFGPGGAGSPGAMSTVDLRVMDILGWTPVASAPPAATDDYASSIDDSGFPVGVVAVGGMATGAVQSLGDRDWFRVELMAGLRYTIDLRGQAGGGGTLNDPYVRLHDGGGALVAENDDVVFGNLDSQIVFQAATTGTYYIEAGGYADTRTGSYSLSVTADGVAVATAGSDVLFGVAGASEIHGGGGNDTITASPVGSYLRGDEGDDRITGGPGFDDISGNMGDDTAHGGAGDDWVVGGRDRDLLFGDDGDDLVYGNLGNDTCDGGAGNDVVRGGQGDDVLDGGPGDDFLSGDRGDDTITGGSGADLFHGSRDAGLDRVRDFNSAEGDRVILDPGTTYTCSQAGADTVIDMGDGHQMILLGVQLATLPPGWILAP